MASRPIDFLIPRSSFLVALQAHFSPLVVAKSVVGREVGGGWPAGARRSSQVVEQRRSAGAGPLGLR
jgi:predicted MFS family arabinose efflux permease